MDRGLFSQFRFGRGFYILAAAVVLILMVGIVLAQSSFLEITLQPSLGGMAQIEQPGSNLNAAGGSSLVNGSASGIRPADGYSVQLAFLAQGARRVSGIDQVNRYAIQVENLAQQGRAASVVNRLPMVGEDYTNYLDHLRSLGQAASARQALRSTGADEYSIQLEGLRRIGVEASTADHSHTTYLDYLRRLGEAAYIRQAVVSTGANEYVIRLDELRRRGAEATIYGDEMLKTNQSGKAAIPPTSADVKIAPVFDSNGALVSDPTGTMLHANQSADAAIPVTSVVVVKIAPVFDSTGALVSDPTGTLLNAITP